MDDVEGRETISDQPKQQRTRQRRHNPAPVLDVPAINDNAPERKRILNVLAQRRYRERRRQQRSTHSSSSSAKEKTPAAYVRARKETSNETISIRSLIASSAGPTIDEEDAGHRLPNVNSSLESSSNNGLEILSDWPAEALNPTIPELLLATSSAIPSNIDAPCDNLNGATVSDHSTLVGPSLDIDPSILFDVPSNRSSSRSSVAEPLQIPNFPDTYLLPVPELKLLQAFARLSKSLGCKSSLWDLTALSPFMDPLSRPNPTVLSSSWAPTVQQRTIPHHPIIDFLPWASVRDRLIGVFSLPDDLKPTCATGPLALVQLAYDMEDSAEGMRIWGDSPCNKSMWEVGQVLFERWWFVFDRQVIEQSNSWRMLRGAPELTLKSPQNRVEDASM